MSLCQTCENTTREQNICSTKGAQASDGGELELADDLEYSSGEANCIQGQGGLVSACDTLIAVPADSYRRQGCGRPVRAVSETILLESRNHLKRKHMRSGEKEKCTETQNHAYIHHRTAFDERA